MKGKKKIVLLIFLTVALIFAATGVTYAVYISQNSYKGVVVSGSARPCFSGDFLQISAPAANAVPMLARTQADTGIVLSVFNYPYGVRDEFAGKNITYDIVFSVDSPATPVEGETYTVHCGGITRNFVSDGSFTEATFESQTLQGKEPSSDSYQINVPESTVILITATPRGTTSLPTLYGKIQRVIVSDSGKPVQIAWEGNFIYNQQLTPADYAAFNYQITGSGVGNYTLKWKNTLLALDESCLNGVTFTKSTEGEWTAVTFHVDSADREMYELRFFKKTSSFASWNDVKDCVDTEKCYVADS